MARRLTLIQVRETCTGLLQAHRRVTVRMLMTELKRLYGTKGRTERVGEVLAQLQSEWAPGVREPTDIVELRKELERLRARAELAEERELSHQHYWAVRYQEKIEELALRSAAAADKLAREKTDQILRLYQRVADLQRRLAEYESMDRS